MHMRYIVSRHVRLCPVCGDDEIKVVVNDHPRAKGRYKVICRACTREAMQRKKGEAYDVARDKRLILQIRLDALLGDPWEIPADAPGAEALLEKIR